MDLNPYKQKFDADAFDQLEQEAQKHFFPPISKNHNWLTNLGKTRIENYLRTREQIGFFDTVLASKELKIPQELLAEEIKDRFEGTNGFWNQTNTIFYFGNYIAKRIAKIENVKDLTQREEMIAKLSTELNIEKDEIANKVNTKLNKIKEMIRSKPSFEINKLLRDLQMDLPEFIKFIDSMNMPYMIVNNNNKIILSPDDIAEEKSKVKDAIIKSADRDPILDFDKMTLKFKGSRQLIAELTNQAIEEKKIKGIWEKLDHSFITDAGIRERMISMKNYIALNTFIEDRELTAEELQYVEEILKQLIENNQLQGRYDEEAHIFTSEDLTAESTLNDERNRFSAEIKKLIEELELTYNTAKEILTGDDVSPSQMDQYETMLNEVADKSHHDEIVLARFISNANYRVYGISDKEPQKPKKSSKKNKSAPEKSEPKPDFKNDEVIAPLLEDYNRWKTYIIALQQRARGDCPSQKTTQN